VSKNNTASFWTCFVQSEKKNIILFFGGTNARYCNIGVFHHAKPKSHGTTLRLANHRQLQTRLLKQAS
jgi:hypothetical protein